MQPLHNHLICRNSTLQKQTVKVLLAKLNQPQFPLLLFPATSRLGRATHTNAFYLAKHCSLYLPPRPMLLKTELFIFQLVRISGFLLSGCTRTIFSKLPQKDWTSTGSMCSTDKSTISGFPSANCSSVWISSSVFEIHWIDFCSEQTSNRCCFASWICYKK